MLPSAPEIILWLLVMSIYSLLISDHIAEWDLVILKMVVSPFFSQIRAHYQIHFLYRIYFFS